MKFIQTFNISPDLIQNSEQCILTSVELYFKTKPAANNPNCTVFICEVVDNVPVVSSVIRNSISKLESNRINVSSNSLDSTRFAFTSPVILKANRTYGIVVDMESDGFGLWENVQGKRLMTSAGTVSGVSSSGATLNNSNLFRVGTSNVNEITSLSDRHLKFKLNVARFDLAANQRTVSLAQKNYEFLKIRNIQGSFIGGETVFVNDSNQAGTISISRGSKIVTGVGTNFIATTADRNIILSNSTVLRISRVISPTSLELELFPEADYSGTFKITPTAGVYVFDRVSKDLILEDSTASDSSFRFLEGNTLVGSRSGATCIIETIEKKSVDMFTPRLKINNPAYSSISAQYRFVNENEVLHPNYSNLDNNVLNQVRDYDAYIMSRSLEVMKPLNTLEYGESKKSGAIKVNMSHTSGDRYSFTAPVIDSTTLDVFVVENQISSTTLESRTRNGVDYDYDTEVSKYGNSKTKYISKKITLAPQSIAEDLKVFLTAYNPPGTQISVYARLQNPLDKEPFDDKSWTKLDLVQSPGLSSEFDSNDLREYEYGIPSSPEHISGLLDTVLFTTANNSAVVQTSSNISGIVNAGDAIKIYNPINEKDEFEVFSVQSANSSSITLNKKVINNPNITGVVFGRLVKYTNNAFINPSNDYITRYFSGDGVEFDGFSSMQIKIVLTSNSSYLVPKVDSVQAVGVSA